MSMALQDAVQARSEWQWTPEIRESHPTRWSPWRLLRAGVRSVAGLPSWALKADRLDIVACLTLVLVSVFSNVTGWPRLLTMALALSGLIHRPLRHSALYWLIHGAILGIFGVIDRWYVADNHKYLITYWCITLGLVLTLPKEHRLKALATTATLLLGLCMAFAAGYKALTPSFRDGTFFRWTLLKDGRFRYVSAFLADIPIETRGANIQEVNRLVKGHEKGEEVEVVTLTASGRLEFVAQAMTWWTLAIETAFAAAFLWPTQLGGPRLFFVRNLLLLTFVCTTYAVAPVVGFGWVLIIMGIAQADVASTKLRAAYLGSMILVLTYAAPYQRFLYTLMN